MVDDFFVGYLASAGDRRSLIFLSRVSWLGAIPELYGTDQIDIRVSRCPELHHGRNLLVLPFCGIRPASGEQRNCDVRGRRQHNLPLAAPAQVFSELQDSTLAVALV